MVAVSYSLVARLEPQGQGRPAPASFLARCRSEQLSAHPNDRILAKCNAYFQLQGAQHQRDVTLSHLLQYSLITLAVVVALAAILGWIAAGRVLRPVHRITAAARAASEHNLSARVALRGPRDELSELAETFDEMLDRLQAAFESQQRFIANASHELRTPLAVMRATVDVVLDNPASTPAELRDMATDIRAAVDHAEHLIGALLILARNERGLTIHEPVDLATIAEDVLDNADPGDLHVHTTLEPALISGDPVLAERLIANLFDNAARYNAAGGEIWISTRTEARSSQLTVANTGPPRQRGRRRPDLSAVPAAQPARIARRLRPRAHHRRVHRRSPRRRCRRPPTPRRRPVHHRHNPLGRVPRPRHGQAGDRTIGRHAMKALLLVALAFIGAALLGPRAPGARGEDRMGG